MLLTLAIILLILWILSLVFHFVLWLGWVLLVIGVILGIMHFVRGPKKTNP